MATVYSLVCWGGKDGKTVTMTIASPCVVSLANHGLRDGTGVVFSTTGALPAGITAGTTYYARSTASGTFNLYDTAAHAIADLVTPEKLSPDYIIPPATDPDVAPAVAAATARAAIESGIARNPVDPQSVAENLRKRLS